MFIVTEYAALTRPDILLGLVLVQTVCKGYQQMTIVTAPIVDRHEVHLSKIFERQTMLVNVSFIAKIISNIWALT